MSNYILYGLITLFTIICPCLNLSAKNNNIEQIALDERKSHYVFMEALRKKAIGEYDSYYELLRYAYSLDTTNTAIAHQLGYSNLIKGNFTNEEAHRYVGLMETHFLSTPEDFYESYVYGDICRKLNMNDKAMVVWKKLHELYPNKQEVMAQLADAHATAKNFGKAIELFDTIESRQGMSIPITLRKMKYYLAANDSTRAIQEVQKLYASSPQNVDYNLLLGNIYMQINQSDSALAYFNRAHEIEPNNGYVYLYKADYYKMQGDSINYDKEIYNALINKNLEVDQKVEILTDYIRAELNEGIQPSERIDNLFTGLIEQHPHESTIHDLYSQYLATIKDFSGACEQLGYALDLEPTNAENWQRLVLLNLLDEDYDAVFEAADKAIEFNPDNTSLFQYIASAYVQIKEYDKAIETYQTAYEKTDSTDYENLSSIETGIADIYFTKGDTLAAFDCYEKALQLNPGNIMAMNNYAYFLALSDKDLDKAAELSSTAMRYDSENPTYIDTFAWVRFKQGNYVVALAFMKAAMGYSEKRKEKPSSELYEHYGDALFMNGHHEEAVTNWIKALELNPDSELLKRKVEHKTFFFK